MHTVQESGSRDLGNLTHLINSDLISSFLTRSGTTTESVFGFRL